MYQLIFGENFWKIYQHECGRNRQLKQKVVKALKQLAVDPKQQGLKAHKVGTRQFGERWAIWATGDLRIVWDYSQDKGRLLILGLGGHSGGRKVYR
ncbi:hypothetical protein COW80_05390 [Candidatus Beckwithbacteria bacterium CG22_combo_CG10-13_8_21_14_all_01_47_9]|uniref:Addiction module toxin RelE n=2 Tax=Candidatus Beckwithiibacteriota TaxID=1752726 RepID=A0A2H0DZU0_9BACT|nr:MAG: hypothetical protein COW80_05390 [Candidatus Beckwithbacteria bacterium CG22_combo_CG10-13_8_21_14_all_01_47_9]